MFCQEEEEEEKEEKEKVEENCQQPPSWPAFRKGNKQLGSVSSPILSIIINVYVAARPSCKQ
ncbi:hypothetical protein E2C01_006240 [Portunus trituberculatus]|uniref:Uncharacterized protein n=1 Tax=Portunus trituberculatus TaxID=210409 RepID=A0A5B7CUP5_PORTR|nr:hypothetical protein [Portunus trituberculatus]